ncbi:hypothetical protein [Asticcacaulis sp. AND118]
MSAPTIYRLVKAREFPEPFPHEQPCRLGAAGRR